MSFLFFSFWILLFYPSPPPQYQSPRHDSLFPNICSSVTNSGHVLCLAIYNPTHWVCFCVHLEPSPIAIPHPYPYIQTFRYRITVSYTYTHSLLRNKPLISLLICLTSIYVKETLHARVRDPCKRVGSLRGVCAEDATEPQPYIHKRKCVSIVCILVPTHGTVRPG